MTNSNAGAVKISVVTAVFNRRGTITDTLNSIRGQTYCNYEHLVQDGGSTDGTVDLVERLADSRTRLVSAPDGGIYDAINRGIARASGDVVGLLHSDDIFASESVLEWIADSFSDDQIDGVYGDLKYVAKSAPHHVVRYWRAGEFTSRSLARGWMPPHPTLFLRRHVFERLGCYDTRYRIAADYDAILRWLGKGGIRVRYIPEVLVHMRIGGESNRSLRQVVRKMREDYSIIRRNETGGAATLLLKNVSKIRQLIMTK